MLAANFLEVIGALMVGVPLFILVIARMAVGDRPTGHFIDRHVFVLMLVLTAIGVILFLVGASQPKPQSPFEQSLRRP